MVLQRLQAGLQAIRGGHAADVLRADLRPQHRRFCGLGVGPVGRVDHDQFAGLFDRLVADDLVGQHAGHQNHPDPGRNPEFRPYLEIEPKHAPTPQSCNWVVGATKINKI